MILRFLLPILLWSDNYGGLATEDCGLLLNDTLKSPGYPNFYPNNTYCVYNVPIPDGMTMEIDFDFFEVEDHASCRYDYLTISNNHTSGVYCGDKTGQTVLIAGDHAVITFHSDSYVQERGFLLVFTAVPHVPPNIILPAAIVRTFPGYNVAFPVTGTPPIYTAIIRNSTLLVNTTNTAIVSFWEEGNYTCEATSQYGTEVKEFSVIFKDCGLFLNNTLKSPGYPNSYPKNAKCVHKVPIPDGMTMKIDFDFFEVEDHPSCRYDYLSISSNHISGVYCGVKTGETVLIAGDYALITFRSDSFIEKRGFLLVFTAVPHVPPNIILPAAIVRTLPGYKVKFPVTGTRPIFTAIIRNSTVLVNTTNTAIVLFSEEGNYTCEVTSKYGTEVKEFSVIFKDCGPQCSIDGTTLSCKNITSYVDIINCITLTIKSMDLSSNSIDFLPLTNLANVGQLNLPSIVNVFLPHRIFSELSNLREL
ncbi:hypothetical protein ACROYT_G040337 [Oculina patagonica]